MSHPSQIKIQMLGGLVLRRDEQPCNLHLCGPTRRLLAFLLYQADLTFRRERLSDVLWPEKEAAKARSALNTAIWRIRKALCEHRIGELQIISEPETVGISVRGPVEIDAHALTQLVQTHDAAEPGSPSCAVHADLARILATSKGLFLDGDDADWVLVERERLLNVYMRGQSLLLAAHAGQGDFERALACGRDILQIDPLHEGVQRQVMWLYLLNGQRARAIQQYRLCAGLLKRELGIAPMSETTTLYRHIVEDTGKPVEGDGPSRRRRLDGLGDFNARFSLVSDERRAVLDSLVDTRI